MFLRDEGSVYDVPLEQVWEYLGTPQFHERAHGHRRVHRTSLGETAGEYSWEQDWNDRPTRFTMRWRSFPPLGIAYEVTDGPFAGSKFLLYYTPMEGRTAVSIAGEFVSPTIPEPEVPAAVERFFRLEFEQDLAAVRRAATGR